DVLRDSGEEKFASAARVGEQKELEDLDRRIAFPLLDRHAAANRLGDLVSLVVEEHLERKSERWAAAQHPKNRRREPRRVGQVLAVELVVDREREPAQRPVDLPLRLGVAAEHGLHAAETAARGIGGASFAGEFDGALLGMVRGYRAFDHFPAPRANRYQRG